MKRRIDNYRIWVKGLVVECPMGEPMHDCPLNALRSLPLQEIRHTVNSLSDERLKDFVATHRQCYNHRRKHEKNPIL